MSANCRAMSKGGIRNIFFDKTHFAGLELVFCIGRAAQGESYSICLCASYVIAFQTYADLHRTLAGPHI